MATCAVPGAGQFPNIARIAITLRESISADHNNWGAMLYDVQSEEAHFAPVVDGKYAPYQIRDIIDRVGGGDAFGAGLIRILADRSGDNTSGKRDAVDRHDAGRDAFAVSFAAAASCLAHSLTGDFNLTSYDEVMALVGGSATGRVVR